MEKLVPENLTFSEVGHLPIIKDFAKKIRLVETLERHGRQRNGAFAGNRRSGHGFGHAFWKNTAVRA